MHSVDRREFLQASTATALGLGMSAELSAQPAPTPARPGAAWDQGALRHVLPTVSDTRLLIKASLGDLARLALRDSRRAALPWICTRQTRSN